MALSSLLVVLNAARLARLPDPLSHESSGDCAGAARAVSTPLEVV